MFESLLYRFLCFQCYYSTEILKCQVVFQNFCNFVVLHKYEVGFMDNMYEHIAALCKSKGVSVTQMCRDLGITRSVLTELKNGRTQRLSIKYTKLILEYFNIDMTVFERPVDEINLLNENNNKKSPSNKDGLTNFQSTILQLLECVPEDRQDELASLIESALKMSGLLK